MENIAFISKSNLFSGDCSCDLHNRDHEPTRCKHYHDFYEFFVYLGESGAFDIDGKSYAVQRGDIVLVDMFVPHMIIPKKIDEDECFVAHVNPEVLISFSTNSSNLLDLFQRSADQPPVYHVEPSDFRKYEYLMNEYRRVHLQRGQDILIKAIIHQLMAYAHNDCFSDVCCDETVSRNLNVVTQIINYINAHLSEKFSLQTLAREVNYSECYICHLFKQVTHRQITSYIQEKRIEMATGLLKRGVPVNKAAEQSGFNNYSHFYKTFKKRIGCSPAEYRNSIGLQPDEA